MVPEARVLITKFPFRAGLGGVEKHTIQIVENLQRQGVKFFLLSSCAVLLGEFQKRGWPARRWWLGLAPVNRKTKFLFLLFSPLLIISAVAVLVYFKIRYGVSRLYCLTLTEKLIFTPIAKILGYRIIWLEHLSVSPVISKNIFRIFYRWWSAFVEVVTVSEFVKRELEKIAASNVRVIPHGIDREKYKKQEDLYQVMAGRRKSEYNRKKFTIGSVSRLERVRGMEYLIRAIDLLRQDIPEIDCVIVGEGSERPTLQWLIGALELDNMVKLVGYKDNFLDWIYDFDVFVLPSLKESFGIILLEAMACSRPVVATRVGGIPEIVEDESTGLLVEPENPKALAAEILRLYREPALCRRLVEGGDRQTRDKFSLATMIEAYRDLLLR